MTGMTVRNVAVVDIGKTNAKLALVDLEAGREITALRQPNRARPGGLFPHHEVGAIWDFILHGLRQFASGEGVDAISVTTHGATAALIDGRGGLALPVLDYEFDGPDEMRASYDEVRPGFSETGSPALPIGLNLGAQLYWLSRRFPYQFAQTSAILAWPQYWAWRLTGVLASEATSLGCHTDLWNPHEGDFSSLVDRMGWRPLFPPLRRAADILGPILPEIAECTGLDPATPVVCGIHDSNASLLPHLLGREPPFAVVSTGTWVVAMAVGGSEPVLDPARDTLINVDAFGNAVPSARFMGGREFEMVMGAQPHPSDASELSAVLAAGTMLLPSVAGGSGPFPDARSRWIGTEPTGGQRHAAVSCYLAMMTATCLDLVGAEGDIMLEGPFASNEAYVAMLEAATGRPVLVSVGGTGTSIGAAMLVRSPRSVSSIVGTDRGSVVAQLRHYSLTWRILVQCASSHRSSIEERDETSD